MAAKKRYTSRLATFMVMGMTAGTLAPTPLFAQSATSFSDVQSNYWAAPFIQSLAQRGIIAGFTDGSFGPEKPVTRAQFAAMLNKAFQKNQIRQATSFNDVRSNYWAANAIQRAYTTGFLSGYPGNTFKPEQSIPRQQVLVSLANGLEYSAKTNVESTLQNFNDSSNIASYARSPVAAATENQIVVNYPNLKFLNPEATATRAQVAAFIYQALVSTNQASAINSPYIVALNPVDQPPVAVVIPQGTTIPVKYEKATKILVTRDEIVPLTLTVSQNVVTERGTVVIPAGSEVVGQIKPVKDKKGSQFVAQNLVINGREYPISATSEVITKTETVNKGDRLGSAVKDAALGAGAAVAVSAVTGDRVIATEKVLSGAAIGGLIGAFFGKKSVDLIVINPGTDLQMTIGQNLQISLR